MKKFFLSLLFCFLSLFPFFLYATWDQLFSDDEDPSLFYHVNVISGHLNLVLQDTVAEGAKSIPVIRSYSSAGALERTKQNADVYLKGLRSGLFIQGGWNYFPHTNLLINRGSSKTEIKAYLPQKTGGMTTYVYSHDAGKYLIVLKPEKKQSQSFGVISGKTNNKNSSIRIHLKENTAIVYSPDGSQFVFEGERISYHQNQPTLPDCYYRLIKEILPSKHQILYDYDENNELKKISMANPAGTKTYAWVDVDILQKEPFEFSIKTSNGRYLEYQACGIEKREYISQVRSNCRAYEYSGFCPSRKAIGARMRHFSLDNQLQFIVNYYLPHNISAERKWAYKPEQKEFPVDKVESLDAPGEDGALQKFAKFSYQPGLTEVRDVHNCLTRYHYSSDQLTLIEFFDEKDQKYSALQFLWEDCKLRAKIKLDAKNQPLFSKTLKYDEFGNILEETLWGNLTGLAIASNGKGLTFSLQPDGSLSGAESYTKHYSYSFPKNLLLVEEEENGLCYRYSYLDDTDLMTVKLTCSGEKILLREFLFYDEDNLLIAEIRDDGISQDPKNVQSVHQRWIKRYERDFSTGLIHALSELYFDLKTQKEVLLRRTEYVYAQNQLITEERVFDAENNDRYTIFTDYDDFGRVIRKTNPVGQSNFYKYDALDHLIESKEVGSSKKIYSYDPMGRQVLCEEIDASGHLSKTEFAYDAKGRLLAKTDDKGNAIQQEFDSFGRCLKTLYSEVKDENQEIYTPIVTFDYDIQGNLISHTMPKNETTKTIYNIIRKPIKIFYPDGGEVIHVYNKNGTLAKTVEQDQTVIEYAYDLFQRMTEKSTYSKDRKLLSQETWRYNAFTLESHTDERGLTTTYSYDGAGRKISETSESRKKTFFYDALGFLTKTQEGETASIQKLDEAGRVLELWQEESSGRIENHMLFTYDEEGRKIKAERFTSQGKAVDHFSYDGKGRLSVHLDPVHAKSQFIYQDDYLNDLGQKVLRKITLDPLNNATIQIFDAAGRLSSIEKQNPQNETVSKEEIFYDRSGNKAKSLSTVYLDNQPIRKNTISWEHDASGHIIKEIEGEKKVTSYGYDKKGRLLQKTSPRGTSLYYSYDGLDRILEQKSSDGTIDYQYTYKKGPDSVEVKDLVHHTMHKKSYNLFGEVLEEINPQNLHYAWEYDNQGRCKKFILPDHSSVEYGYLGLHLHSVKRVSSDQEVLYEHCYKRFDPNGHVEEESFIGDLGKMQTFHDLLERPKKQTSAYLSQEIFYNASGLVVENRNSLLGDKHFSYDALNQLTQEEEKSYHFDSLGNAATFSINDLNQVMSAEKCHFSYDLDGNPIERCTVHHASVVLKDHVESITEDFENDLPSPTPIPKSIAPIPDLKASNSCLVKEVFNEAKRSSKCTYQEPPTLEVTSYQYDALGRLVSIIIGEKKIDYGYDDQGHLLFKEIFVQRESDREGIREYAWEKSSKVFYLYDQEKEIGKIDEDGTLLECKILGLGIREDVGAAVAIELEGEVFAPLHDFQGNIIALLSLDGSIFEQYEMDAFGKEKDIFQKNPWRFCSKRFEEGLIFFGKRFYDPSLGRWLTPDPSGFSDSANLYIYVLNSPLNRLDLFGLFSDDFHNQSQNIGLWISSSQLMACRPDVVTPLSCRGCFNGVNVDILLICSNIHKLNFTPEEQKAGKINLLNHLAEMVPKEGSLVGAVTFINGINTNRRDFAKMSSSIVERIPEGTLFFGIRNKSHGFLRDFGRAAIERKGIETSIVSATRQFLIVMTESLHKINHEMILFHITHSEGGLITEKAIEGMTPHQRLRIKEHMFAYTVGSAAVISTNDTVNAINVISSADNLGLALMADYSLNNPFNIQHSNIQILPCITPKNERMAIIGDHAFLGRTYQDGLKKQIRDLKQNYGFYDAKNR